ncbi:MAG: hypothetical protein ACYC34_12055, partial [Desulfobacteria bacterium]
PRRFLRLAGNVICPRLETVNVCRGICHLSSISENQYMRLSDKQQLRASGSRYAGNHAGRSSCRRKMRGQRRGVVREQRNRIRGRHRGNRAIVGKEGEIDIVGLAEDESTVVFGEARWSVNPVGTDILNELEKKARLVDWRKGERKEYFVLFSRSGFTETLEKLAGEREDLLLWK